LALRNYFYPRSQVIHPQEAEGPNLLKTPESNQTFDREYDVVILGAGAAGLFAGFTAATRRKKVLILEKSNKVGKKILMSGGGRCNFTNEFVEPDNFISDNSYFCISALQNFNVSDFLSLVHKHDIDYEIRKNNQFFCKNSSRDILEMLLNECQQAGVRIETHTSTTDIDYRNNLDQKGSIPSSKFLIKTTRSVKNSNKYNQIKAHTLIIATGALSVPTLGGSDFGYTVAKKFGLKVTERHAGLVPFVFNDKFRKLFASLAGVSTRVRIDCNRTSFTDDMLFTHRGLSGPVILQISNYWREGNTISINLLPGINASQELMNLRSNASFYRISDYLHQHLPKSLVSKLQALWWADLIKKNLSEISNQRLNEIGTHLNNWLLKPPNTEGYQTAEVTRGGVDTAEVSSKTMEVTKVPGLYFIGEVLDVTGQLGGFNFQWAWASGYSAGMSV